MSLKRDSFSEEQSCAYNLKLETETSLLILFQNLEKLNRNRKTLGKTFGDNKKTVKEIFYRDRILLLVHSKCIINGFPGLGKQKTKH